MKIVKNFNEYLNESFNVNKVQFLYKRLLNSLGVKLFYASKYETAIIALLPVIDNLINAEGYIFEKKNDNIILITLYVISILTHESTDKINKIHEIIKSREITDTEVQYLINGLNNLRYIFSLIAKNRNVESFYDMLQETDYLIPFLHVINHMIINDRLNINMFTGKFDGIKNHLGEKGFDLLIHNILNKMNVALGSDNKFQNINLLKPLLINDELKGPMYKTGKLDLGEDITESLLNKLEGPSENEVLDIINILDKYDALFKSIELNLYNGVIESIKRGAKLNYKKTYTENIPTGGISMRLTDGFGLIIIKDREEMFDELIKTHKDELSLDNLKKCLYSKNIKYINKILKLGLFDIDEDFVRYNVIDKNMKKLVMKYIK